MIEHRTLDRRFFPRRPEGRPTTCAAMLAVLLAPTWRRLVTCLALTALSAGHAAAATAAQAPGSRDELVLVVGPPEEAHPCAIAERFAKLLRGRELVEAHPLHDVWTLGNDSRPCTRELPSAHGRGLEALALALANAIASINQERGAPVDVVALSGAGAVVATMLEQVRRWDGRGPWPEAVGLRDVLFIAPPFGGSATLGTLCEKTVGGQLCTELRASVAVTEAGIQCDPDPRGRAVCQRHGLDDESIDVTVLSSIGDVDVLPESSGRFVVDHQIVYDAPAPAHDELIAGAAGPAAVLDGQAHVVLRHEPGSWTRWNKAPSIEKRAAIALVFGGSELDEEPVGAECYDPRTGGGDAELVALKGLTSRRGMDLVVYGREGDDGDRRAADNVVDALLGRLPGAGPNKRVPGWFAPETEILDTLLDLFDGTTKRRPPLVPVLNVLGKGPRRALPVYLADMEAGEKGATGLLCDPATKRPSPSHHVAVRINRALAAAGYGLRGTLAHEMSHVLLHSEAPAMWGSPESEPTDEGHAAGIGELFEHNNALVAEADAALAEYPGYRAGGPFTGRVEYGAWRLLTALRVRLGTRDMSDTARALAMLEVIKRAHAAAADGVSAGPALRGAYNAAARKIGCLVSRTCNAAFSVIYHDHWHEALENTVQALDSGPVSTGLRLRARDQRRVRSGEERARVWTEADAVAPLGVSQPLVLLPAVGTNSIAFRTSTPVRCRADCIAVARARDAIGFAVTNSSSEALSDASVRYRGCSEGRDACLARLCPATDEHRDEYCDVWEFPADDDRRQVEMVALGDAFAAGGIAPIESPSWPPTLSRPYWRNCGRSGRAWPRTFRPDVGRQVHVRFLACWPSVVREPTPASEDPMIGPQVSDPSVNKSADLVTLTFGAQDTGLSVGRRHAFPTLLAECLGAVGLMPPNCYLRSRPRSDVEYAKLANDFYTALRWFSDHLHDALTVLKRNVSKQTTVVLVGYPQLVAERPGIACGAENLAYPDATTERDLALLRDEIKWINIRLREEAEERGLYYLPVEQVFAGHELCSAQPWINGPVHKQWTFFDEGIMSRLPPFLKDVPWLGDTSFLPNEEGHSQIALALRNFLSARLHDRDAVRNPSGLPRNPTPRRPTR